MNSELDRFNRQQLQSVRRSLQTWGLLLLLAMVCVGCTQSAKPPAVIDPVGKYTLASVDGNKVPCALKHEGFTLDIRSGSFTIDADGTCLSSMTLKVSPTEDFTKVVKATYTRQDSKLTMKWEGAGTTTGTVEGNTFTMVNEGNTYVYRK